jgi:hypothetical protein
MKTRTILTTSVLAIATVLSLSGTALAAPVGLKLGINNASSGGIQATTVAGALTNLDLAGATIANGGYDAAQTNWNNLARWGGNSTPIDENGTNTVLTITWDCSGIYSVLGSGTPAVQTVPDNKLMNGYDDSNGSANTIPDDTVTTGVSIFGSNNNKPWMYITNLSLWLSQQGACSYDVVIYAQGDTSGRVGQYWIESATGPANSMTFGRDLTPPVFLKAVGRFTSDGGVPYTQVPLTSNTGAGAQSGNFIVFPGLSADTIMIRTEEYSTRSPINAIQLIPQPAAVPAFNYPPPATPQTNSAGTTATFFVPASGGCGMTYQWMAGAIGSGVYTNLLDGGNLWGSTTARLIITNIVPSQQADYVLKVSNGSGSAQAGPSSLYVQLITTQTFPQELLYPGMTAHFVTTIASTGVSNCQWFKNSTALADGPSGSGSTITGSLTPNLTVSPVGAADAANYWLVVSNSYGMTTSVVSSLSLLAAPTPGSFAEAVVTNAPLAYWRFDELDSSSMALDNAGGLNGTYGSAAIAAQAGAQPPTYLGFDSTNAAFSDNAVANSWVTIPALNLNTNTVTFVAWVYLYGNQNNWAGILTSRHNGTQAGFNFSGQSGKQNELTYTWDENTAATYNANVEVYVTNGVWTMVALVVTPTNAQFYACDPIGGIRSGNYGYANIAELFYGPGTIGVDDTQGAGRAMNGLIDEVAVFNHALSPTAITWLYVAGTAAGAVPPPTIAQQPLPAIELYPGQPANFSVVAAGLPPFSYQWRANGVPLGNGGRISGATNATLTVSNTQPSDATTYDVVVSNNGGSVTSAVSVLTLTAPTGAAYEAAVMAAAPVAYWRLNEANGSTYAFDFYGGHTATYQIATGLGQTGPESPAFPGFEAANTGVGIYSFAYSSSVTAPPLNLNTNTVTITAWINPFSDLTTNYVGLVFQRQGLTIAGLAYGNSTNHLGYNWNNVAADYNWDSGLAVPVGEWSFAAVVIEPTRATVYLYNASGQLAAAHTVPHAVQLFDGTTYIGTDPAYADGTRNFNGIIDEVSVWNRALSGDQIAALYTAASGVGVPPSVVLQPVPTTLYVGKTNQLSMTASGTGPYAYQWYTNGVAISNGGDIVGATNATLSFTNAALADTANYYCVVTTTLGRATSSIVAVTVLPAATSPVFAAPATATFANLTNQTGLVVGCEDFGATEYSFNITNGATVTAYDFKVDGSVASVAGQSGQTTGSLTGTGSFGFTSGNTNFDNVLNEASYDGGPKTITIKGLIPGRSYAVQIYSLDDRDTSGGQHREQSRRAYFQDPYNLTNVSSTFYMSNNFYVKTTFTAAFTNQVIVEQFPGWPNGFTDVGAGQLEALVVRDVSTTPAIQSQPVSITRYPGAPAAFSATVYGPAPIGYQWQRDGGTGFTNLAGSGTLTTTAPTVVSYSNPAVAMADAASYRLVVTNSSGSTTSQVATLTMLALPAASTYDRAVLSYGPLAYWEFNEAALSTIAYDYAGGFDGAYQAFCTNGLPGLPVSFGGLLSGDFAFEVTARLTNSWVTVPALNFNTNTVTFTAWIYPIITPDISTQADWAGILMTRAGISAGIGYGGSNLTNGNMLTYTWNGDSSATYGFVSGLSIPSNQWSFVAVAISPTNASLYLINADGFQTTNNAIAHTSQNWNGLARIGNDANTAPGRNFNGIIDDVAVFTRTLSPADIQNLYAAIPLAPPTAAPTGLTATAGDGQVALSWNGTPETDSYNVKRSTTPGGPYSIVASNVTSLTFTNTASNGTWYYFVVSSVNLAGQGPNSAEASARPVSFAQPQITYTSTATQVQLTWPADHTGYRLLTQTNAPGVGLTTNWVTVPGSTNNNTLIFPIDGTQGSVFFRLVYP